VRQESLLFLFLQLTFLLLVLLLPIDHTQEIVALGLRLLRHVLLALAELFFASELHILCLPGHLLAQSNFLCPSDTFALLASAFRTQGVNLSLTICRLLLHLAKTCNFGFFLQGDAARLFGFGCFGGRLLLIVTENIHVFFDGLLARFSFL